MIEAVEDWHRDTLVVMEELDDADAVREPDADVETDSLRET